MRRNQKGVNRDVNQTRNEDAAGAGESVVDGKKGFDKKSQSARIRPDWVCEKVRAKSVSTENIYPKDKNFPEVTEFGCIGRAIEKRFVETGCALVVDFSKGKMPHYGDASVEKGSRHGIIRMAKLERYFICEYTENDDCVAYGDTSDFLAAVDSMGQWVSGSQASVLKLTESFPFLSIFEDPLKSDELSEVECRWRELLWEARFGRHFYFGFLNRNLPELVLAASREPKLRRLLPYTSHDELHFSRCTDYPWTYDTPWLLPLHDERRFLVLEPPPGGEERIIIAEGEASEVVQIAADQIPDDLPPVWEGTAKDEDVSQDAAAQSESRC